MDLVNLLKLCIILTLAKSVFTKTNCDRVRNEFANAISDFERCAIQKAVPIAYCSECLKLYIANLQSFNELISTPDGKNVRLNCGDHVIDQNSLNIVYNRYISSRDLWNSGHCTNCFVPTCNPDKIKTTDNITQICPPNANVGQIKTKIDNLNSCIQTSDSKKGDVCKDCAQNHTQLESHLERLGAGVCSEILDMVNSTNQMWYHERNCPKLSPPSSFSVTWIYPFIAIILFALFGAGGFFALKKYRSQSEYVEQIQDSNEDTSNSFS